MPKKFFYIFLLVQTCTGVQSNPIIVKCELFNIDI